jgi:hypothetical protein
MMAVPFALGANVPWIRYGGDFGANAWWPGGGLAATGIPDEVRDRFHALQERGVTTFRWFLFCDGRAGINFSDAGEPLGLDDRVLPDLDAALTFASEARIQIVFTLFDFLWCAPREEAGGVNIHGRQAVIADSRLRGALLERVVCPVLDRYGRHTAVYAWDVMNEPEWALKAIGRRSMRTFITETVSLVRERTSKPVTVGLAGANGLDLVREAGLDFYQVHWYDKHDAESPLARPVADYGLDGPLILGEFPTKGSRRTPAAILDAARDAGYAGAWFWSMLADDDASDYAAAIEGLDRRLGG